jgi:AcrR family transcriptional regulator
MAATQLERKEDLRIRRTYKLLSEALLSLLEERPFDKISVIDICDKAMVHRTTFYKHFEDKYQLLVFSIKGFLKDFSEKGITNETFDNPKQYYLAIFKNVLTYMAANPKLFLLLAKNETDSVMPMFIKLVTEDITSKLKNNEKSGFQFPVPVQVIAHFYAGALFSLIKWWLINTESVSIDAMVRYFDLLMEQDPLVSTN